jgi:hypothetical protein
MAKKWVRQVALALAVACVAFFVNCTYVVAQGTPFYWDYINVSIDVQVNGDMLITEEQKYVFTKPYTNQRYRYISLRRVRSIQDVTVEENGQKIASKSGIENGQFWIRWSHHLQPPKSHVFVLKYRVVGGIQLNDKVHQLYWKAIFAERPALVNKAKVRLRLPPVLAGKVNSFKSWGVLASRRQLDPRTFEFVADQPLPLQQELGVQVDFPSGILEIAKANMIEAWIIVIFGFLACTVGMMWMIVKMFSFLVRERCPECNTTNITVTRRQLNLQYKHPREWVVKDCNQCSHHHEFEVIHGVGGGGGDGGGGGGDGGGGGGGDGGG